MKGILNELDLRKSSKNQGNIRANFRYKLELNLATSLPIDKGGHQKLSQKPFLNSHLGLILF